MRTQIPGKQILDEAVDTVDITDGAVTDEKLSTTGVAGGTYTKVTVSDKGRVTAAQNPTTLAGYGITDAVSKSDSSILTATSEPDRTNARHLTVSTELVATDGGPGSTLNLSLADNVVLPGAEGVKVPSGTTAERPAVAAEGSIRYNETTEELETYADGGWYSLVHANDLRLRTKNTLYVQKEPGPGQFSSVKAAMDSIQDATSSNRYVIRVAGGSYAEPQIVMKRYVSVVGDAAVSVILTATEPNKDFIVAVNDAALEHLTLNGATGVDVNGNAVAAIRFHNAEENQSYRSFVSSDIRFGSANTCIKVTSDTKYTALFIFNGQFGGSLPYNRALHVESTGGGTARILARGCTTRGSNGTPEFFGYASGPGAELFLNSGQFRTSISSPSGVGVALRNGATARILSATFRGFSTGIWVENAGTAPFLYGYNVGLESNTMDVVVEHPGTQGTFQGSLTHTKLLAPSVENLAIMFMDPIDSGLHIVGKISIAPKVDELTDVTDLLIETPPMGLIEGGALSRGTGTQLVVGPGSGYVRNSNGVVQHTPFVGGMITLTPGTSPYIYINAAGQIQTAATPPSNLTNILLGRSLVGPTSIISIGDLALRTPSLGNTIDNYLRTTVGPVYVSGSIVTENATTPRALDITAGQYWFGTVVRNPNAFTALTFLDGYRIGTGINMGPKTVVPNDTYTDGNATNGLVNMTPGYYAKHALYQTGTGPDVLFLLAHATQEFATVEEVYAAPLPTPAVDPGGTPHVAALIVQQGRNDFVEILDVRPKHFRAGASSGSVSNDHGDLLGLSDDDHQQYLLVDGTRAMSDDLNLGTNNILNVGLINGLDIAAHASRHQPNGADPLPTGPGTSITPVTVNGTGTSNTFSRADHTHSVAGLQPLSSELTALGAVSTFGFSVHTAANTWVSRTLTSEDDHIVITNGNGVAGNPVFHLGLVGTPGTYQSVTTDEHGRVVAGTNQVPFSTLTGKPTTLSGYGITDAQPLDADLTALSLSGGTGFYIRTGDGTSVTRALTAPAAGLTITNPDGVANAPVFALANDLAAVEALATNGIAVRTGTDTWATRTITAPAAGLTISSPLTGNITFALANDLLALENLTTVGIAVRTTAAGAWATRTLKTTTLSFTNPAGTAGDIAINLPTVGAAGTYTQVTTDAFGRVTAGANPTTLAGYGITDAINISQLGVPSGVATLDSNGKLNLTQVPAIAITDSFVVANEAAMLALVAEVGDIAIRTDQNETYILQMTPATTLANWKKLATPTDAVSSVNGQTGAVTLNYVTSVAATQPAAGLTITGSPITSSGTLTFALANDLAALEGLTGTGFPTRTANDTWVLRTLAAGTGIAVSNGDGIAGAPTVSLLTIGTAGTYRSVTTDAYGRVTAGTNPTTLAGYGITDAQPLDSDLTALANTAATGLYTITGVGTSATRSLVAGAGISITNANGVAGNITVASTGVLGITATSPLAGIVIVGGGTAQNPSFTFNLANDLAALEGLTGTGIAVRTGTDTWANRALAVGTGLSIANADGVAGNPTISLQGNNTAASGLLSSWTLVSGVRYYADFAHNLGTNNVVITLYDTANNAVVTADDIVLTNTNTVRVTVVGNSRTLRIVVVANGLAINTATPSAGTIAVAKDSVNVSATTSRLNFTGQAVSITDAGAGTATVMIGSRYTFFATSLDSPVNSDWAVNAFAPTAADPTYPSLTVRQFVNTTEQGVGLMVSIPGGATTATFRFRGRPLAGVAGATNVVGFRMYARWIGGTMVAGAGGWQAVKELGEIPVPASSAQVIYSGFTIPLSTLALSVGGLYQIELTRRVTGTTGTNLATSYLLYEVSVEIS